MRRGEITCWGACQAGDNYESNAKNEEPYQFMWRCTINGGHRIIDRVKGWEGVWACLGRPVYRFSDGGHGVETG